MTELSLISPNDKDFALVDGIIRHKGRVWVGNNSLAQQHILQDLHASGIGGHSGIQATYHRIKVLFSQPKLKQTVTAFVQSLSICQQAKVEHYKLPGLLQPFPIPETAWIMVSMNFIEGLPKSGKWNAILVVIDKFNKYAHFVPISHPYIALSIAQQYFNHIYKLHGLPTAIISDRDRIFTSTLWKELFALSDTQLLMSSSYHPQTEGQTERLNQCLEGFLRCVVHACPREWAKRIPLVEYWYNTSFHTTLGTTPFQVLYGHRPQHLGIPDPRSVIVKDLSSWLTKRNLLQKLIQQQLERAQQRMKQQADKKRTEREFQVGDRVYLKLQPHIEPSVALRSNHKLSFWFFGPFLVLAKVGKVAYKLYLPDTTQIHLVVHVSQLKRHVPLTKVIEELDAVPTDPSADVIPIHVLEDLMVHQGGL